MQKERGEILSTADCEVIITETMAERLQIFFESSDIFFILPGGLGTLNEFIQALELKKHGKLNGKIYLVNIFGFYDQWIGQLDTIANEKFLPRKKMDTLFQVISDLEDIKIILHS